MPDRSLRRLSAAPLHTAANQSRFARKRAPTRCRIAAVDDLGRNSNPLRCFRSVMLSVKATKDREWEVSRMVMPRNMEYLKQQNIEIMKEVTPPPREVVVE